MLVKQLKACLTGYRMKHVKIHRYVTVDDGSTDDTQDALLRIADRFSDLIILKHETNKGYGAAEKTLLNYAVDNNADIAILLHSDGREAAATLTYYKIAQFRF